MRSTARHPGWRVGNVFKLLGEAGFEKLKQFVLAKPTFGTCAGAILLAKEVENPAQAGLGHSTLTSAAMPTDARLTAPSAKAQLGNLHSPLEMVFIRAPKISRVGRGVDILATEGNAVAVRQGRVMAATFHPELSEDTRVHEFFLNLVRAQS